jgi:putative FmdB family regulatory protein
MPMYEYQCRACDHKFELLVREATRYECPKCESRELEKQLSVFAVSAPGSYGGGMSMNAGPSACGACGDPRGAGSCRN